MDEGRDVDDVLRQSLEEERGTRCRTNDANSNESDALARGAREGEADG